VAQLVLLPIDRSADVASLVFVVLVGWRLTPTPSVKASMQVVFHLDDYIAEARVKDGSAMLGKTVREALVRLEEGGAELLAVVRARMRLSVRNRWSPTHARARRASRTALRSHLDRLYWPDAGITTQGLAEFYAAIWEWIAPHVVHRPLSLLRCPDGIDGQCFFQKHAWAAVHPSVARVRDREDDLLVIHNLEGLISLVQAGALEIHPWGAAANNLDRPDRLVFDLDPGGDVPWAEVIAAGPGGGGAAQGHGARQLRQDLRRQGLSHRGPGEPQPLLVRGQ
jgi:hypothetical protein